MGGWLERVRTQQLRKKETGAIPPLFPSLRTVLGSGPFALRSSPHQLENK